MSLSCVPSAPRPALRLLSPSLLAVAVLGGCSLLPAAHDALSIHDLRAPDAVQVDAAPVGWQLAVEIPDARAPVSGVRMAVVDGAGAYSVVRGARWSLPAPQLVQSVLVAAFEHSGHIAGVGPARSLRGDCRLGGELRAFAWRPATADVRIEYAARLQCGPGDKVVGMRSFEVRAPVTGTGAEAIARAFDAALAELMPELVDWVLETGTAP